MTGFGVVVVGGGGVGRRLMDRVDDSDRPAVLAADRIEWTYPGTTDLKQSHRSEQQLTS